MNEDLEAKHEEALRTIYKFGGYQNPTASLQAQADARAAFRALLEAQTSAGEEIEIDKAYSEYLNHADKYPDDQEEHRKLVMKLYETAIVTSRYAASQQTRGEVDVDKVRTALEIAVGYIAFVAADSPAKPATVERAKDDCRIMAEALEELDLGLLKTVPQIKGDENA